MSSVEDARLQAKVDWYEDLYALDDSEDEPLDESILQSMAILKRKRPETEHQDDSNTARSLSSGSQPSRKAPRLTEVSSKLSRTVSAPPLIELAIQDDRIAQKPRPSQHNGGASARAIELDVAPVQATPKRLFDGLHFYFFPDNDKNPARKLRIQKALEHGATWSRDWGDEITHVVVDRSMDFTQVLRYLKRDSLPPHINVVDERYPADCIVFRTLLDPTQKQYHIKGYKPTLLPKKTPALNQASPQLKPPPRSVQSREPQTHSQRTTATNASDPSPAKPSSSHASSSMSAGWEHQKTDDELASAIEDARRLNNLLIDEDDDSPIDASRGFTPGLGSSRLPAGTPAWQKGFQCMQQHTAKDRGPNEDTITLLQEMAEYYTQIRDEWRPIAYRKAIATLRKHPVKVTTKKQAEELPFIGERLAAKIEEIAYTGFLRRLESAKAEPTDQTLQLFLKVYGIGYAKGMNLVAQGHKSLDDLRRNAKLDNNQKIGLEHFEDFNSRIPREEVKQHADMVAKAASSIDADFTVYPMGSYRRGAETSGDIDVILTHPSWSMPKLRLKTTGSLVPHLFKTGFLKCALAATSKVDGSKWHGASALPGSEVWRRIDLLIVPAEELGAALIYFTGNDIFNRSMRLLARKKGMRLNQRGLYRDVLRGKGGVKMTEGELIEGRNERKIFDVLGVPWREPWERVC